MASDRQIAANRRNAAKSTGPRTEDGKMRSRQNAVRHGLTAETVVPVLEDRDEYETFEAAIRADYRPQSAIEEQLVARIASLLWRLRRTTLMEAGLFEIQGRIARQRRRERQSASELSNTSLGIFRRYLGDTSNLKEASPRNDGDQHTDMQPVSPRGPECQHTNGHSEAASVFLRICNLNNNIFERLGRYEVALWRQLSQTLVILELVTSRNSTSLIASAKLNRNALMKHRRRF